MEILVVYESMTGNTKQVAEAITAALSENHEVKLLNVADILENKLEVSADLYFLGSWTNKGNCGNLIKEFVKTLKNKQVAIFATAGYGGSKEYYANLTERFKKEIDDSNNVIDSFFCQGQMQEIFRDRYTALLHEHPDDEKLEVDIKNFDAAKGHPNQKDLKAAKEFALKVVNETK